MKILSSEQIRAADAYTIENEPIPSVDLMERAAGECSAWIRNQISKDQALAIFCGVGNNGGDGLVVARHLAEGGYDVIVYVAEFSEKHSTDFDANLKRLEEVDLIPVFIKAKNDFPDLAFNAWIVDCIFGTGLARPVEGLAAEVIDRINDASNRVIAIDIPSGLFTEDNSQNDGSVIIADITLTFEVPKLSFLTPSSGEFVGQFELLNIGLDKSFIANQPSRYAYANELLIKHILRDRPKFSHKGSYGHVLVVAGSLGKMGAAVLASKAVLKSGAGLVTTHVPMCGMEVLQTAAPEGMATLNEGEFHLKGRIEIGSQNVVAVGPGIGTEEETANMLKVLIQDNPNPIVLDADALNILAENTTWLAFLPKGSILTPHPGEFKRLVGSWDSDREMLERLSELSSKNGIYVVLKGSHTAIAGPDGSIHFNSNGNAGMATAGSGDVLTGMIAGVLAQGYTPLEAAIVGVFMHGLAGDRAADTRGMEAVTALDILDSIDFRL